MLLDRKKVEEAAKRCFNTATKGITDKDEALIAFKCGAHWAIEQFLKDLWHDIRQERIPKKGFFLIEMAIEGRIFYVSKRLPAEESILSSYLRQGCVRRWSNLEDLLKHEEGGE